MNTPEKRLFEELLFMLTEEQVLHEEERVPIDRAKATDHAVKWLKGRDPQGTHQEYVRRELRRVIATAPMEPDCYLGESLLHRLEAEEDWFRGGAGSPR